MADVPDDLKYTAEHEWAKVGGTTIRVGVTDYAQEALGERRLRVTAEVGAKIGQATRSRGRGDQERVRPVRAGDRHRHRPQRRLESRPELINSDPYARVGSVEIEVADASQLDGLLDAAPTER